MSERTAMLELEIRQGVQPTEFRQVTKSQPVSIGRHVSNDICIDDSEVAPIHCRVSWKNTQFEVASANRDGVDLNGTLVRHSALKAGDVLRIGPADLVVLGSSAGHRPEPNAPKKALDDLLLPNDEEEPEPRGGTIPLASAEVPFKPMSQETPAAREGWDRSAYVQNPWSHRGRKIEGRDEKKPANPTPAAPPVATSDAVKAILDERADDESSLPQVAGGPGLRRSPGGRVLSARLSDRFAPTRVRPGEQDALRSPIILGMLGIVLALGLTAAAIYFVIGRETTRQEFDAAVAEYDSQRYGQAAELFEKFLQQHGKHKLAAEAQYRLWNARVLKEIGGGSPAWKRGLETVDKYVDENRDRNDFRDHYPDLVDFLQKISLGAAGAAQASSDRSLLDVASAAQAMLPRFSPDGKTSAELTTRLRAAIMNAQNAIIKHDFVTAQISAIEKANGARDPMLALAARRSLLARYSEVGNDAKLATLLKQTLDVEKGLVVREDLNQPASQAAASVALRPLTLTGHAQSHAEEPSGARPVFVIAKDCCYAVDQATGEPMWRRIIGLDSPFFPISVETSHPGLLLFDSNRLSLDLVDRRTGKSLWQQTLGEAVSGPPLIDQGQIYLATSGRHLDKIDLESGRISTRLTFSQKILSPPALSRNRDRLIVAGDASLIYTLTTSPLQCIRVTDLGQSAGSLVNGATAVGGLVLFTETGRPSGTQLHVFDAQDDDSWLKPLNVQNVEGIVSNPPVIHGKMLFVPSAPPARISAFAVSDAPGHESVTPTTSITIPNQERSPIFLSAGPDGQLWMAGSSLRRLQLKLNSQTFSLDPAEAAVGLSSQPLQVVGQYLFAARRLPYAGSVFLSRIDREPMIGQWRTIFGSSIIGRSVGKGGEVVTVGEAGDVFSIDPSELNAGGFKWSASATLDPAPQTKHPLRATTLADGKIAIDSAEPKPTVWLVGLGGQVGGTFSIDKPLEAPPVQLAAGLVLPLPGRLRIVSPASGVKEAEDQLAPLDEGKTAQWKSVARIGDTDLVALDSRGRLSRFQYRTEPVRNLTEVVWKKLERPTDTGAIVVGSRVAYADVDGTLQFRDASSLETVASHKLPAAAVGSLWAVGPLVFLETRDHQLACYESSGATKLRFLAPLGATGPAGSPTLIQGSLVVANRDGSVLSLDPALGTVLGRATVGQPLSGGAISVGGHAVVTTIEGSLYRVDSVLEPAKK